MESLEAKCRQLEEHVKKARRENRALRARVAATEVELDEARAAIRHLEARLDARTAPR
jgi:septal ring factor EnvC (AmiA/AmiB activator)